MVAQHLNFSKYMLKKKPRRKIPILFLIIHLFIFKESSNPLYQNMYKYMESDPSLMTNGSEAGIERVYNGKEDYAFLMESKSIEYVTERKCNLTQIGEPLDDKNYGIGMRKSMLGFLLNGDLNFYPKPSFFRFSIILRQDFKFNSQLSEGVLQLQERGVLATLYKKWWKERCGGGACSVSVFSFCFDFQSQ